MKRLNLSILFNCCGLLSISTIVYLLVWLLFYSPYSVTEQIQFLIVIGIPLALNTVAMLIARSLIKVTLADPNAATCNMVIHEFRNVLTVTIGYSEMLLLNPIYEKSDLVQGIYDKSLEALDIIKDIKSE